MLDAGLAGFELGHRENLEAGIRTLRRISTERDLIVTGSSDYHGLGKPNQPGEHTTTDDMVARIIDRATGTAPVYPLTAEGPAAMRRDLLSCGCAQLSALVLMWSNSAWVIAPESSSDFAFAISSDGLGAGDRLDVLILGGLVLLGLGGAALGHALAAGDQVDQQRQERHEDQEDDPDGLPPAVELVVAEQVTDDGEQRHQVGEEDECPAGTTRSSPRRSPRSPGTPLRR